MAALNRSLLQDQIADVTECSICSEIFKNPKVLPCVHTFCLHCLESYGKDKKRGDGMVCPICRKEFVIPVGGFSQLPSNFFIGKMVEIGKLAMTPPNKSLCALCPEEDEVLAQLFCVDCEQDLCSRCGNGHRKSKSSQHHQVIELGSQPNAQELNLRNSYCDHHPGELLKMYCCEDKVAICLICCVESHQSHRCVNVNKAAVEFTEKLKQSSGKVASRLSECLEVGKNLENFKKEFQEEIILTEGSIRDKANKMIKLIQQHTELLVQHLKSVAEINLKAFEVTKQDIDRFRVMIDSYSRYSENLLTKGSPVDICRAVDQMLTRAHELETLPANCTGNDFCCNKITFNPLDIENLLKSCGSNNSVGALTVAPSSDRHFTFGLKKSVAKRMVDQEFLVLKGDKLILEKHVEEERGQTLFPSRKRTNVPTSEKKQPSISDRAIKVDNIPSDFNRDYLEMIFESRQNSGGNIDIILYDQENRTAVITFKDPEVAKTFVHKKFIECRGCRLAITAYADKSVEKSLKVERTSPVSSRMVVVSEIPPTMANDELTRLLEKASWGVIERIDRNQNCTTAVVTFREIRAADFLISKEALVFKGKRLSIARHA